MAKLYAVAVEWEGKDSAPLSGCIVALAKNSSDAHEQIMARYPQFYKKLRITNTQLANAENIPRFVPARDGRRLWGTRV